MSEAAWGSFLRTRSAALGPKALLVVESTQVLDELAHSLRSLGISPIVALTAKQAIRLIAVANPDVAILVSDGGDALDPVMRELDRCDVPTVLVAHPQALGQGGALKTLLAIPAPSTPEEIASATLSALREAQRNGFTNVVDAGPLKIDLAGGLAYVDGRPIPLPPKEFALLAELALNPAKPISSGELIRRVWPEDASITAGDVHGHIYRLRHLIGDRDRVPPLIVNRRGFGYLLNRNGL